MNHITLIYSPFPSADAAKHTATALLQQRLVACANILPAGQSLYHWEGGIACEEETVLLLKTSPEKANAAAEALHALHPYDVPAIITLENAAILPDYAAWLQDAVQEPQN